MSNPNLTPNHLAALMQALSRANTGRAQQKTARLSAKPVAFDSDFSIQQQTYVDPATGQMVTSEYSEHFLLACGCRTNSPLDVKGACPGCCKVSKDGQWLNVNLICRKHTLCTRCRQARLKELQGGGLIRRCVRRLFTLLLWPFFDVYER